MFWQADRLTLYRTILQILPIYQMSTMKFTKHQIHTMESIIGYSTWGNRHEGRKIHVFAWDKITTPFKQGGLGIIKLNLLKKAMLTKQFWKIIDNPNRLSSKVIIQKYDKGSIEFLSDSNTNTNWKWKDIRSNAPFITNSLCWQVRTSDTIELRSRFWWQTIKPLPYKVDTV